MDELVSRVVDQAFMSSDYGPSLKPPVESFVVCLVKNKNFSHTVKLRTSWSDEIQLQTKEREITRLRAEWQKVVEGGKDHSLVKVKHSRFPRRLPLPAHATLSLDILATPAEIRDTDNNPENSNHWSILLASALAQEASIRKPSWQTIKRSMFGVATPEELLTAINADRRKNLEGELTMNEIIVRVADEAFARRELGLDTWPDVELFLECLVRNKPFVYPMRRFAETGDEMEVYSTKEQLQLPRHTYSAIDIFDLPWDASTEKHPLKIDWTRIILYYHFPREKPLAKTGRAQ